MTAAVVLLRQRRAIEALLAAGAVAPGAARVPAELGIPEGRPFRRLVARGVVRRLPDGRCHLDPADLARRLRRLRRIRLVVIALLLLVLGVAVSLT